MKKSDWPYGEQAETVGNIARECLVAEAYLSLSELCTRVQRELSRKGLKIDVNASRLRGIITADKRSFNYVRCHGSGMQITLQKSLLPNIVMQMVAGSKVTPISAAKKGFAKQGEKIARRA